MEFGSQNGHVPRITKVTGPVEGAIEYCATCGHSEDDHDFDLEEARAPITMGACRADGCACYAFVYERD